MPIRLKPKISGRNLSKGLLAVAGLVALAPAAHAACRVTDFTDRTLSSLGEIQRLAFVTQMTQTEFARLRAAASGSPNHYALIANSANVIEAKQAARAKIASLKIENSDYYTKIWASDYLNDDQLRRFTSCTSNRRPGVTYAGRPDGPGVFHLAFTHLTPVGVEKITIRPVASRNIANIAEFEAFLASLGEKDNFPAQTFAFRRTDPAQPAVVIFRAGFETPAAIYMPVYPAPEVRP
jgi:hypothetical protein